MEADKNYGYNLGLFHRLVDPLFHRHFLSLRTTQVSYNGVQIIDWALITISGL
jgi:hypothetical protein